MTPCAPKSAPAQTEAPAASLVDVDLERSSWVVERGIEHRHWRVKHNDAWLDPADVKGGVVEVAAEDPEDGSATTAEWLFKPPGCQYLCRYRLRLPVGTELELTISRPRSIRPDDARDDPLFWSRHVKPPRTVVRRFYRVRDGGRLSEVRASVLATRRQAEPNTEPLVTTAQMEAAANRLKKG